MLLVSMINHVSGISHVINCEVQVWPPVLAPLGLVVENSDHETQIIFSRHYGEDLNYTLSCYCCIFRLR